MKSVTVAMKAMNFISRLVDWLGFLLCLATWQNAPSFVFGRESLVDFIPLELYSIAIIYLFKFQNKMGGKT